MWRTQSWTRRQSLGTLTLWASTRLLTSSLSNSRLRVRPQSFKQPHFSQPSNKSGLPTRIAAWAITTGTSISAQGRTQIKTKMEARCLSETTLVYSNRLNRSLNLLCMISTRTCMLKSWSSPVTPRRNQELDFGIRAAILRSIRCLKTRVRPTLSCPVSQMKSPEMRRSRFLSIFNWSHVRSDHQTMRALDPQKRNELSKASKNMKFLKIKRIWHSGRSWACTA